MDRNRILYLLGDKTKNAARQAVTASLKPGTRFNTPIINQLTADFIEKGYNLKDFYFRKIDVYTTRAVVKQSLAIDITFVRWTNDYTLQRYMKTGIVIAEEAFTGLKAEDLINYIPEA